MIFRSDDGENPQPDDNGCGFFRFMGKQFSIFSPFFLAPLLKLAFERKEESFVISICTSSKGFDSRYCQAAPINQPHKNKDCPGNEVDSNTGTDTTY